jgi:hypothetical protein
MQIAEMSMFFRQASGVRLVTAREAASRGDLLLAYSTAVRLWGSGLMDYAFNDSGWRTKRRYLGNYKVKSFSGWDGSFYVMDRGYLEFSRLHTLHQAGAYFVIPTTKDVRFVRYVSPAMDPDSGLQVFGGMCLAPVHGQPTRFAPRLAVSSGH